MSSLAVLDRDLCGVLAEMRSEKISLRTKAFEKLELMLNNREEDMLRYMAEQKFDTGWHDLLDAAHHGIQKQNRKLLETSTSASGGATNVQSKCYAYIKVIQKVVELAMNREQPQIKFSEIIRRTGDVLSDPSMLQNFGVCYVQILQKHVLNSKWDLTVITYDEWIVILTQCFELYRDGQIKEQVVVTCMVLAVRRSLENCSVQAHFVKFLDPLKKMIVESDKGRLQNELIKVAYSCSLSLAVDFRYEICSFTENIIPQLVKGYESKMEEEMKTIYFRLMHLALIVHNPEKSFSEWRSNQDLYYAQDESEWYKCIRNMHFIVGCEIRAHVSASYNAVGGREMPFVDGFIPFAARLCYLIFWHDEVWSQTGSDNGSSSKKVKRANKLQSLMDLIGSDSNQFEWRWLVVLAEIVERCPAVLEEEDYHPLLHLLSTIQPKLNLSIQLNAFRLCCIALVKFERQDAFIKSSLINGAHCLELWQKIAECCFRCSTSNNKSSPDNHQLLQLLIASRKYPSVGFLNGILQAFYAYSIDCTNNNVATIRTLLETVPLELFGPVQETVESVFNYLFPKSRETQAKGILYKKERLDAHLVAVITVNCVVTKHNQSASNGVVLNANNPESGQYYEPDEQLRNIEENILLKRVEKLITIQTTSSVETISNNSTVIYNIHEKNFELLCTVINFEKHTLPAESDALYNGLINIVGDVELYLYILNELLIHSALGDESFEKCLITKKITFKIQELELGFERLKSGTLLELTELSHRLLAIFSGSYHPLINQMIKTSDFTNLFEWIFKKSKSSPERDSRYIDRIRQESLNKEQLIQHNFLAIVANYMKYDGVHTNKAKDFLDRVQLNIDSNVDLFYIFQLSHIFVKQRSTFFLAEWILTYIKDVCRNHHSNCAVTEAIIDLFAELVIFVSPHEALFDDINTVLLSFLRKANKQIYSVRLQRKIYDQVKFLLKAYPNYFDSFETIFVRMVALIKAPSFLIQMSGVENLLYLFADEWAFSRDNTKIDFLQFQQKLYSEVNFQIDSVLSRDEREGLLAAYLQLICGSWCQSYHIRKQATWDLVEQAQLSQVAQHKVQMILKLIGDITSINAVSVVHDCMETIIDKWVVKYQLKSFPWCIVACESLDKFIECYQSVIAFAIIRYKPSEPSQLCRIFRKSVPDMIKQISTRCVSYLIPNWVHCVNMPQSYLQRAAQMEQIILKSGVNLKLCTTSDESLVLIVQHLLDYLHDTERTWKLAERETLTAEKEYRLNSESFTLCLDYLKSMLSTGAKQPALTYLCSKHPSVVERIFMFLKLKLQHSEVTEDKLTVLFKYSTLLDLLLEDYFGQQRSVDLKQYLIRDICYFLCHSMMDNKFLHVAILNMLTNFVAKIISSCAEYLEPYLNFLVSSLLVVYDQGSSTRVAQKVLNLLNLMVIESYALLGDGVKKLNYFPDAHDFTELRQALEKLKETQHQLTLSESIDRILELPSLKYEELTTVRELLCNRKENLRELCSELEASNGFSDSCSKNIILRLINVLLDEIRNGSNDSHTVEALRCLGEIGPIDLATLLLRPDTDTEIYEPLECCGDAIALLVRVLLTELNKLIVSSDLMIVEKATLVCYHLFRNKIYRELTDDTRAFIPYMTSQTEDRNLFERSAERIPLNKIIDSTGGGMTYASFVLSLSSTLLDFLHDTVIKALAEVEPVFAATIIPLLLQIVLSYCDKDLNEDVQIFVNSFFGKISNTSVEACISNNLEAINLMLKIVECVRLNNQNRPKKQIKLNYLDIAAASLRCGAYFKAILYCELWCLEQQSEGSTVADAGKQDPQLMSIMKTAYMAIGIDDAAKAFLDPIASRNEYYQLERRYGQSLLYYDVASTSNNEADSYAYSEALKRSSLYGLAKSALAGKEQVDYDCAWRLADWNVVLEDIPKACNDRVDWEITFKKQHYKALKCLHLKDAVATGGAVFEARKAIAEMLKVASMESTKNMYPFLCKLRQLQQVEDFMNVQFVKVNDGEKELLHKWDRQDQLPYSDFSFMEVILVQRATILQTARIRALRKWVPDALNHAGFQLIYEARVSGHHDVAMTAICAMNQQTLSDDVKALLMLEDAQLNWAIGDKFLSKKLVNEIVAGGKCKDLMVNAAAFRIYGSFLAETHAEDVQNVYKNFFRQSQALVEESVRQTSQKAESPLVDYQNKCLDSDRNFIVLHTVAKYADREFARLKSHFASTEFQLKKINLEKLKKELALIEAEQASTKESEKEKLSNLRRAKMSTKQNAARDEQSIKMMQSDMENYLKMALLYYSSFSRKSSVESDLAVFRIVALWLGNYSAALAESCAESLQVVPTYKFVPVLAQLVPRLDNRSDGVGKMVFSILERCANDHAYHTLPHIFAQVYAFADVERSEVPKDDERLLGAQALYHKLRKNAKISQIVDQYTDMNLALIEMANKTLGSARGFSDYTMTAKDALRKCRKLDKIHCPTVDLKVQENATYNEIIGIVQWDDQIQGVGGINAPKKLVCQCTDGQERIQLLKGKDDMRQDAVMQQVFNILNILLRHDKEANKRKLTVRTYKVVPLSRQSGILEWCSNTLPFGAWVIPAHERYRPKDLTPLEARKAFAELAKSSTRTKQEKFLKICQRLSPVFQHFFLERFLLPGTWFERRLCYTRSVAVSSMVGYILGIGDRHVQNILVDEKTAEVIHIDFGIAFELGKNLPTPETIPFRLTRDIVAGMGVSGIEGIFRKSCQKTMEILRNNHSPIMTILEVLLYDPLYTWNVLSNKKAARKQMADMYGEGNRFDGGATSANVNISAERALLRVSDKLNGKEDEKYTSVEGQVERLNCAASSNLNLCQLFHGWQPYL
ncbi:serine/threonine-protein kinase ATM [Sabethes cyaneus]|uniref:serine/threonine-protein kinase ATM n=1 Tax=Sabethes cyaneus TaxID=53552 RepID=UPI00237DF244|nr:serine/threonine-protein kinase ATM [Sabethes cyaneus]